MDVVGKGAKGLEHLAGDGLGFDILLPHPRVPIRKGVEGRVDELAIRLGMLQLFQLRHSLLVIQPGHLHFRHLPALELVQLLAENDVRIFEDGFHQRQQHQRVIGLLRIHLRQGLQQVERQRLVHRKVLLQFDVDTQLARPRAGGELDNPALHQRAEELPRAAGVLLFGPGRFMAVAEQPLQGAAAVARAAEHVEQHPVRNLEPGGQALGLRGPEPGERLLVPVDEVLFRRLALDDLLAVPGGLFRQLEVLDDVLRRLGHHPAPVIKTLAPGAPADLVKVARAEDAGLLAVIFAEPRKQHGADGHVNAHAERVGAANDFEQPPLRQLLHQHPVLGQQPGMVQPDAVLEPLPNLGAVGAAELEPLQRRADGVLLLARADVDARKVLRALGRFQLGEVNHIHRRLALRHQALQRRRQRQLGIGVFQRHRPIRGRHGDGGAPVQARELRLEERRVAQRGGHEEKPRLRQRQQRHLPRHAALPVGVIVKLVHDDLLHVGRGPFAQGEVGQNLRRAAQDRRVAIDRGIARAQADIVRPELAAQPQPFLVHQRLDGTGINGAFAPRDGLEMHRRRHQRFARPGGRVENHVLLLEQLQDGRLLRRVKLQPPGFGVFQKAPEQRVIIRALVPGQQVVKG